VLKEIKTNRHINRAFKAYFMEPPEGIFVDFLCMKIIVLLGESVYGGM